ncbi:MAG: biotin--[acetyl-CoA-carboxylase] ligase [Ignavibacteriaceae bacterium]|nr:biotin--[acetyl-CoA-carboxylase] ligase [Ignavibacteriaceae bacterium]
MDEQFDISKFYLRLDTEWLGRNLIYTEETSSTNSYLMDKENKVNKHGTVVLAEKQTSGKGRLDRVWYSNEGENLTFSMLFLKKDILSLNPNILNLASSLAVANVLESLHFLKPNVKWPNDVLVNGKKICGILLEAGYAGSTINRLVVGIGLNVNQAYFQGNFMMEPTSVRMETDTVIDREKLLAEILKRYEELLEKVKYAPEVVLKEWSKKCRMIGDRIEVKRGEESLDGIFDEIDGDGYLILRTKQGTERISYGDVSVSG